MNFFLGNIYGGKRIYKGCNQFLDAQNYVHLLSFRDNRVLIKNNLGYETRTLFKKHKPPNDRDDCSACRWCVDEQIKTFFLQHFLIFELGHHRTLCHFRCKTLETRKIICHEYSWVYQNQFSNSTSSYFITVQDGATSILTPGGSCLSTKFYHCILTGCDERLQDPCYITTL